MDPDRVRDAMRTVVGSLLAAEDERPSDREMLVGEFDGDLHDIAMGAIALVRYLAEVVARTSNRDPRDVLQLLAYDAVEMSIDVKRRDEL